MSNKARDRSIKLARLKTKKARLEKRIRYLERKLKGERVKFTHQFWGMRK